MRSFAPALPVRRSVESGRMPERSIGTDCKSVGLTPYEGSNPSPTTIFFFVASLRASITILLAVFLILRFHGPRILTQALPSLDTVDRIQPIAPSQGSFRFPRRPPRRETESPEKEQGDEGPSTIPCPPCCRLTDFKPVRPVHRLRCAARVESGVTRPDTGASRPRARPRSGFRRCGHNGRWCRHRTARWPHCRGPGACPDRNRC